MLQDKFTRLQEVLSRTFLKSCSIDIHVICPLTHSEAQRTWQNSVELCRPFYLDLMTFIITKLAVAVSLSRQKLRNSVECSRVPEQYIRRASSPCKCNNHFSTRKLHTRRFTAVLQLFPQARRASLAKNQEVVSLDYLQAEVHPCLFYFQLSSPVLLTQLISSYSLDYKPLFF